MTARLMVYVRVKPLNEQRSIIDIVDEQNLIFDPRDAENQPQDEYFYHGKKFKSIGARRNKNSSYTFDRVFDANATNYHIYETVTKPMVDATINGFNSSVFAYGATGSGKTYTMLGKPANPGVIYFTSRDLFNKLTSISQTDPLPADLKICYFEIYNEKVRDLLVQEPKNYIHCGNKRLRTTPERCRARQQLIPRDNHNLPVCDAPGDGASLVIPDLTYHRPSNADQLIDLLAAGNANRSQHPTDANADSSRSHAIFQIVLTRRTRRLNSNNNGAEYELQSSKMSLIDLAGSERASVAYRGDRSKNLQREGGNINKSLLALGNCINALADPKSAQKHIPYRNSKLTRLLRDSLGGKCRTAMIATVCQQQSHYDDTQNTLVYASRAKCIKLRPNRNFTDIAIQPKNYIMTIETQYKQISTLQSQNDELKIENDDIKMELKNLKSENEELRNQLNNIRSHQREPQQLPRFNPHGNQTFTTATGVDKSSAFLDESQYLPELESLYEERSIIRMDLLKYESKCKINELKVALKQLDDNRQQIINGDLTKMNDKTTVLIPSEITNTLSVNELSQALKTQLEFYEKERRVLIERAKVNEMRIRDVIVSMTTEFNMKGYGTPEDFDLIIEPFITERELLQELDEKKFCEQHAYDLAQNAVNRLMTTESLLIDAIHFIRYSHAVTIGRGFSDPCENKRIQVLRKMEGKKSVIWKDDKYAMENDKNGAPLSQLSSVHDNFSLNYLTPFRNNNTLHSRRLSKNLVSLTNYTPEQSHNITFDASQ